MLTTIHTIYPSIHNAAPAKCSIILSFLEVEKKKKMNATKVTNWFMRKIFKTGI